MIHFFVCEACAGTPCHLLIESGRGMAEPLTPRKCPYEFEKCKFRELGVQ